MTDQITGVLDTPEAGGRVIRGGALRIAGYAATVLLSVVSAALLIRHLGASDFGRYITVFSLVTIVGAVAEAGMTTIGIREYSTREGPDREGMIRNLTGIRLLLTALGAAAVAGFAALAGYDGTMIAGTVLGGLGLLLTALHQTWAVPLSAGLRFGSATALDLFRQVVTVAAIVALVLAGADLLPFLAVPVLAGVALVVATVPLVRRFVSFRPQVSRLWLRRFGRLALPFALAATVGTIYVQVVVILMSLLASQGETGIFGAAFRVFTVVGAVPGLLVAAAFPVLSRAAMRDEDRMAYALERIFEVTLILGAWIALSTILGAGLAIDVIAGEGFEDSVAVLRIQGVALLASFLLATWSFALAALHRHRALLVSNLLALALTILLALLLVPPLGAQGGALAGLAGESVLCIAYAWAMIRSSPRFRVAARPALKVGLATALAGTLALADPLGDAAQVVLATAVYFAVLLWLRAIPQELFDEVPKLGRLRS